MIFRRSLSCLVTLAALGLLLGCVPREPETSSGRIALIGADDGSVSIRIVVCEYVIDDLFVEASERGIVRRDAVALTPEASLPRPIVDLPLGSSTPEDFQVTGDWSSLQPPPLSVTVDGGREEAAPSVSPNGRLLMWQTFDRLPEAGEALFLDYDARRVIAGAVADFESSVSTCP